ncbi:MAG: hypothetical protein KGV44_05720 [Flavobacteriaceae bacterium]|nr:hypothetical protein [Flavobacteriaceae bacterium]
MKIKLSILLLTTLLLSSCNSLIVRPLLRKMSKELVVEELKNKQKEVTFVRMVHIARPEFYDQVAKEVKKAKENGAILFYEFIDFDTKDTLTLRKVQKIAGFVASPKNYAKMTKKVLKKGVLEPQDNTKFLNLVNNKDFIVDYTPQRFVKEYEEEFGEIVLTKEDLALSLDEVNKNTVPEENKERIILDHRNKHLAKEVQQAKSNKIVILYGADHFTGFMKELQKLDKNWVKVKERTIKMKK